jgi:DtxR family Mn-dependent transcriptional regulator
MERHVLEDYVKHIYELTQAAGRANTAALATAMGVPVPGVSKALPRLAAMGLVTHDPYRGAELTETGRLMAVEVIRHHRLAEMFLHKALGMSWDEVHAEAERLEHVLSDSIEARMDAFLGFPTEDPHGDPIPTPDLHLPEDRLPRLSEAAPGHRLVVRRVSDRDDEVLRHLEGAGIVPGAVLSVLALSPMEGIARLDLDGAERILALKIAEKVFVEEADVQVAGPRGTKRGARKG